MFSYLLEIFIKKHAFPLSITNYPFFMDKVKKVRKIRKGFERPYRENNITQSPPSEKSFRY
jgi:hypothetical protein